MTLDLSQPSKWPVDNVAEMRRRAKRGLRMREDREVQIAMKLYYSTRCAEFINDFCVTFDPRLDGMKRIPFVLFDRQRQFVDLIMECLTTRESALVEKCRDVGASWICVAISVWLWLFQDGATVGWGSRKEEYVDQKGNPKAIFPKIRQTIEHLPHWMLPYGFSMRDHAPYMKIINPVNDATITGEAGDNIGRGGRSTIFFKDESAHYERPELIEAALSENTDCQIDISSVNGSANVFYRRRMAKTSKIWTPGCNLGSGITRVFIFDWRDHPGKDQQWYDEKRERAYSEGLTHIFAQEIDRDYAASVVGIIIRPEWVQASIDAHKKLAHLGNWFAGEKTAGQDIADDGGDKNGYVDRHGVVVQRIEHWAGEAGDAARVAVPFANEHNVTELYYDSIGVGAGFKTEINTMMNEAMWRRSLLVMPWTASASPLNPEDRVIPGDDQSPTNEDQYANLKAQAWFMLRARFWKTYQAVTQGKIHPIEEMVSIPSDIPNMHQLTMELSQAIKKTSGNGRTLVDKKAEGSLSPNLADAMVMCYCPVRELSILDVI